MATTSGFHEKILLPPSLKEVASKNSLTQDMLDEMSNQEWEEFLKRCENAPLAEIFQVRRVLQKRSVLLPDEVKDGASLPLDGEVARDHLFPTQVTEAIVKLFDEDEGIGTLVFINKSIGITAFHCVFKESSNEIRQATLKANGFNLQFMVAYPSLDLAVYKAFDEAGALRDGGYLMLENDSKFYVGNAIYLLSFPAFDSQSRDEVDEEPSLTAGVISRLQLCNGSLLAIGEYSSFPNSSGGAIVSSDGKLVGLHTERIFFEDHRYFRPPASTKYLDGAVRKLSLQNFSVSAAHQENAGQPATIQQLNFVYENIKHKESLGVFFPASRIRPLLHGEGGLLPLFVRIKRWRAD